MKVEYCDIFITTHAFSAIIIFYYPYNVLYQVIMKTQPAIPKSP